MEELCFSKINLGLAILEKREDGYHNIDTIFQSIMLGDSIYYARHHSVVFSGAMPDLPKHIQDLVAYDETNLAMKALRCVQEYTKCKQGAAIHLLKRVPVAAGLGGGSSNAAAMIRGLNKFWDLRLTEEEMMDLARPLGADVAFFMKAGTARGTGIGEHLRYMENPPISWLLVVRPAVDIFTGEAYAMYQGDSEATKETMDAVENALVLGNMKEAFASSKNTFEELLFPKYPELASCKEFFTSRGYETIMTGSGPTMVVLLPSAKDALFLQEEIKKAGHTWLSLITKTKDA